MCLPIYAIIFLTSKSVPYEMYDVLKGKGDSTMFTMIPPSERKTYTCDELNLIWEVGHDLYEPARIKKLPARPQ